MIFRCTLLVCAAIALLGASPPPQSTIDGAAQAVKLLRTRLGKSATPLLAQAKAIVVAPASPAEGAILSMRWNGHWSEPAFFDATSLHGQKPAILLIMTDEALNAVLHQHGLTLDGPDGLSLAPLPGKTTAAMLLWPKTAQLDPAGFYQDDAANTLWYGRPRNAPEIVGGTPPDLRSSALRSVLEGRTNTPAGAKNAAR